MHRPQSAYLRTYILSPSVGVSVNSSSDIGSGRPLGAAVPPMSRQTNLRYLSWRTEVLIICACTAQCAFADLIPWWYGIDECRVRGRHIIAFRIHYRALQGSIRLGRQPLASRKLHKQTNERERKEETSRGVADAGVTTPHFWKPRGSTPQIFGYISTFFLKHVFCIFQHF